MKPLCIKHVWLALGFFCVLYASTIQAQELQAFSWDSKIQLEQHYAGEAMLMVFWSVDCSYCQQELQQLSKFISAKSGKPKLHLITVCTDTELDSKTIHATLDAAHVPSQNRWQFAEQDSERLRYQIDSRWYGELPRSYFYTSQHQVTALSGKLDTQWLQTWLKQAGLAP